MKTPTRRNLPKLLETYRAIEQYRKHNIGGFPSTRDLVKVGIAGSPSVVKYYFEGMEEMNMMVYVRKIARSSYLLPLDHAHPAIRKLLETEGK